ncbi:MAG: tetratricopeptide repeat protein [Tannerella sp.]|jgi:tetratricopeptide (TPR) repeat protein|nr:tetratricopeptide repeat protein [Tannerella sp.]
MKRILLLLLFQAGALALAAQVNTDRVMAIGRNAFYFEDYVLSIRYFNQVIRAKSWMAEPYFYRAIAKLSLDDFQGAEEDCNLCLARNPFMSQAYYARGIARHSQEKYDSAIEDYKKGLMYRPDDRAMMTNKAIAYIQKKDYTEAEGAFDSLVKAYPKYSLGYLTRGAMYMEKGDTALALADYNKAVEIDPYYAPCYGNRAIVLYQTNKLKEALSDLNEAIRLNTRESGYYINRGLVRYQMNDLRGAMADYDQVISMDSRNLIARFNRGLLRFQVGDNNRAIEDFDVVIEMEPDNYMAYYNRALLNFEVGDYLGAVQDYDVVLGQYPNFLPGYYSRSDAKRKLHDNAGADRDYWTAIDMEQNHKGGQQPVISSGSVTAVTNPANPANADPDASSSEQNDEDNTREQSDKNIGKFNRLVVYDKEEEQRHKYQSEIRGRVQDRNVRIDLEPSFTLTFYEKSQDLQKSVYYDKTVDAFNARMALSWKLIITNNEAALTEEQIAIHFASINEYSSKIEREPNNADYYFGRALDYMLVQDFTEAIQNFDKVIALDPSYLLAYFNRAVVRYKQMDYYQSQTSSATYDERNMINLQFGKGNKIISASPAPNPPSDAADKKNYDHELIVRDYDLVIQQNPGFIYSYYNRGNIRCIQRDFRAAIVDYNEAILRDPEFAEAYFNRGLARLSLGDANRGIADLSKAGELGIMNAYSIIKRMTSN